MRTEDFLLDLERQLLTAAHRRSRRRLPLGGRQLVAALSAMALAVGVATSSVLLIDRPVTPARPDRSAEIALLSSPPTNEDRALMAQIRDRGLDAETSETARTAIAITGGDRVWAHRKDDQICLVYNAAGGFGSSSCAEAATVTAGQPLTLTMRMPQGSILIGLLPDGPQAVTLVLADGTEVRRPLERNVFLHRGAQPVRLRWSGPDGPNSAPVESVTPARERRAVPGSEVNPPRP